MKRRLARIAMGVPVFTVSLVACVAPLVAQTDRVRQRDPGWIAPRKDASQSNPLTGEPSVVAGGQKVYGQRCHTCHGDGGRGTHRAPSLVEAEVQAQTDGALFWKITGGNTHAGMPSFSFLPQAQRWQLVVHLRRLARERP